MQIELYLEGSQVDAFHMESDQVVQMHAETMQEIQRRAADVAAPRTIKCLTYEDDEGDACTLTKDTLLDAFSFVTPLADGYIGALRIQMQCFSEAAPVPQVETPAVASEQLAEPEARESAVLAALNKLVEGSDLRLLVPKLAEVALNVVATAEEPSLFALIDVLTAFQEGKQTAEDLPAALPEIVAVVDALPEATRVSLLAQAHAVAKQVISQLQENAVESAPVEVHVGVACDGCNSHPIVGPRFKSAEEDNVDLCAVCFGREERKPDAWVQIKSDVRGDVVSSYYAAPADAPINLGVQCDGCDMIPIVGRRFKACGEDFDLCSSCMDSWRAGPNVGTKTFEEITVTTATVVGAMEEARAQIEAKELADVLSGLNQSVCQQAIEDLLRHSNEEVRSAVRKAVAVAKNAEKNGKVGGDDEVQTLTAGEAEIALTLHSMAAEAKRVSAKVVSTTGFQCGPEASEDASARGDVTSELADVVAASGATQMYRIGRIVMPPMGDTAIAVPTCAKLVIVNDGEAPWPETAALTSAFGPCYEFPHMDLGAVQAGEAVEIVMDLSVAAASTGASRSAWAIIDSATGALLGPILCFEVLQS